MPGALTLRDPATLTGRRPLCDEVDRSAIYHADEMCESVGVGACDVKESVTCFGLEQHELTACMASDVSHAIRDLGQSNCLFVDPWVESATVGLGRTKRSTGSWRYSQHPLLVTRLLYHAAP
nr:hypothetical protein CFP56_74970 [Quercus suber]